MRIGMLANLAAACAIALALGACQSTKGAGGASTAAAPGPIKTLQEAIGGKAQGALVAQQAEPAPQGAPVIAQQPAAEVQASAYAPTSAPATSSPAMTVNQASAAGPITNRPQQAQAKPATQVVPAKPEAVASVPTVPVHTSQDSPPAQASQAGPVRTLVDALRGGSAGSPRGALVPSVPAEAVPPPAQAASASPVQPQQPDRLPYDGRVSVQGPQMQTYTISPSMPDPRVQRALRDQGAGTADYRPPSDSDLRNLF